VYVGNLDHRVAWQDLGYHMSAAGDVMHATDMTKNDGRSKGFGIVEYRSVEGANAAVVRLNRTVLLGRQIFVREDRNWKKAVSPIRSCVYSTHIEW
jgi:RNA recognition motif-containing protein